MEDLESKLASFNQYHISHSKHEEKNEDGPLKKKEQRGNRLNKTVAYIL